MGPPRNIQNFFWQDTLLKMGFQTYIFCSKVPSKCRKFQRPKFQNLFGGTCTQTGYTTDIYIYLDIKSNVFIWLYLLFTFSKCLYWEVEWTLEELVYSKTFRTIPLCFTHHSRLLLTSHMLIDIRHIFHFLNRLSKDSICGKQWET